MKEHNCTPDLARTILVYLQVEKKIRTILAYLQAEKKIQHVWGKYGIGTEPGSQLAVAVVVAVDRVTALEVVCSCLEVVCRVTALEVVCSYYYH